MIRHLIVAGAAAVLALAVVVAGSERDDEGRYTRAQVVQAFAEQGFALRNAPREIDGHILYREGSWLMVPRSGEFLVYLTRTRWAARELSASIARIKPTASLPPGTRRAHRFAVLEGNVYVESIDPSLSRLERKRVRAAVRALRGAEASLTSVHPVPAAQVRRQFRLQGLPLHELIYDAPGPRVFSSALAGPIFQVYIYETVAAAVASEGLIFYLRPEGYRVRGNVLSTRQANVVVNFEEGRASVRRRMNAALTSLG